MTVKCYDHETGRHFYAESVWDGRLSLTAPYQTVGTLSGYVPADRYGRHELVSVSDGRAVDLSADASTFRSTWKAA